MKPTEPKPLVPDFWRSCGYSLTTRGENGRLAFTDDFLRGYLGRPELAPVAESCAAERALHAALIENPQREVTERELAAIDDDDARENYGVWLRFRGQLMGAPSLEAFYAGLFRRDVAVPPAFIRQIVQVILRSVLDGCADGLAARAAEVFFRRQRVSVENGSIMLADNETVEMHAATGDFGNLGQLLARQGTPLRTVELDVLDEKTSAEYWKRDERFDTVLCLNRSHPGCAALCRVIEAWVAHFHGARVKVVPVPEIPDADWVWHVGLDAEATAILNDTYSGREPEEERLRRIVGLYRMEFLDPADMRAEIAGRPVFLGLAMAADHILRMKPQNLLTNLPLARPA